MVIADLLAVAVVFDIIGLQPEYSLELRENVEVAENEEFEVGVLEVRNDFLLSKKIRTLPIDIIVEADASENEIIKAYQHYQGQFLQDFELVEGEPVTWQDKRGNNVYQVTEIDQEEMKAWGTWLGEIDDVEILKAREKIEANRLRNRKWARVGIKLFSRFESIEDEVKTRYFQQLVRKGLEFTSYDPDKLLESVEEEISELETGSDEEEQELHELIQDLNPETDVEQKIEITGNKEEE